VPDRMSPRMLENQLRRSVSIEVMICPDGPDRPRGESPLCACASVLDCLADRRPEEPPGIAPGPKDCTLSGLFRRENQPMDSGQRERSKAKPRLHCCNRGFEKLVPRKGLEPSRLAAHGPEPCASTNSAIW